MKAQNCVRCSGGWCIHFKRLVVRKSQGSLSAGMWRSDRCQTGSEPPNRSQFVNGYARLSESIPGHSIMIHILSAPYKRYLACTRRHVLLLQTDITVLWNKTQHIRNRDDDFASKLYVRGWQRLSTNFVVMGKGIRYQGKVDPLAKLHDCSWCQTGLDAARIDLHAECALALWRS
jgi:hypothetical protein